MAIAATRDVKQFWQEVVEEAKNHGPVVYLVTQDRRDLKQRAGVMMTAENTQRSRLAPILIVEGTHRVATAEEINKYEADNERERKRLKAEAAADGKQNVVVLTPEMMAQIRGEQPKA